jgi:hypothetical protein
MGQLATIPANLTNDSAASLLPFVMLAGNRLEIAGHVFRELVWRPLTW